MKIGFKTKRDTRNCSARVGFFHHNGKSPTSRLARLTIAAPLLLEERRVRSSREFRVVSLGICGVVSTEKLY